MPAFLILRLEAPLMAFGREAVDANGPTRDWPDASLLTGLLANALGFNRGEWERHQRLQDRLVFGVRIDRLGHDLRDFQTAKLEKNDKGWTTRGVPEGRAGGQITYDSPHIRFRHYRADASLSVAIRLQDEREAPTLADLAIALEHPTRPLFIGRKPCLPAEPLLAGMREADSLVGALQLVPFIGDGSHECIFVLPPGEADGLDGHPEILRLTGRRNWRAGVHTGEERVVRVRLPAMPVVGVPA